MSSNRRSNQEAAIEREKDDAEKEDTTTCSICLDSRLNNKIRLPDCDHSFCSSCLKSQLLSTTARTCPQCGSQVPSARKVYASVCSHRQVCDSLQKLLDEPGFVAPDDYRVLGSFPPEARASMAEIAGVWSALSEEQKQQWDQLIRGKIQDQLECLRAETIPNWEKLHAVMEELDDMDEEVVEDLPIEIGKAAGGFRFDDIHIVLDWLEREPIPAARLNAQCREHHGRTLLHEAEYENNTELMALLLQAGAKVDPRSTSGQSPFEQACMYPRHLEDAARLLLTWGAVKDHPI